MSKLQIRIFLTALFTVFALGCQSAEKIKYDNVIHTNTRAQKVYAGFHQSFEANITAHTREVTQAVLNQQAEFRGWDDQTLQLELQKANDQRLNQSLFFLRFFVPESDYDDLHKPNSIWKIYLTVDGQRFQGKVKKDFSKLVEIQTIYPFFDRFSTAYEVTFPIGRPSLEGRNYTILLTSSLGKAEFNF